MRMTPTQAVKRYCLSCTGGQREDVRNCTDKTCAFWIHRTGKPRVSVRTIRQFCLECTNGSQEYMRNCPSVECLCYPYRMARNPNITRKELTPEQRAMKAEVLLQNRKLVSEKGSKFESFLSGQYLSTREQTP